MARVRLVAFTALAIMAGLCGRAFATIIYDQPAASPVVSVRASQFITPPGAFNFQTFDNFTLNANTSVVDVHWQGAYFNALIPPASTPAAPNATGFGVNFYSDNAGLPGGLLASYSFSPGGANETFIGNQFAPNLNLTLAVFSYDVVLAMPFLANAGTSYWLSVFAFSPAPSTTEAQWGWVGGTGGNGTSVQNGAVVNLDRAFALTVPEPAALGFFVGAVLTLLWIRRRADGASAG